MESLVANGSNLAPLYAFCISLIVCAHIPFALAAWLAFWAIYAYRRMHMSPNKEKVASDA